ncbi:hypothetical protein SDRG_04885 [Saprolegnia diclina VS20]|uniref:Uncharacterized protein n=1 Tax=Saprolegnia diclina (strain VS20) TaxID=1156394 RepID=T0QIN4_SAPDV|nr:hypothetical protein SDRG_04885 [Saprolegnia diclina VS20]EQC37864.1 hypothetical protein SDRG_04885 [Saprolegnia diclina VS20]|eukprot:XP_008608797.1 hypothetical protein SDRG_04885 [Saprolegnia diclina VS20]
MQHGSPTMFEVPVRRSSYARLLQWVGLGYVLVSTGWSLYCLVLFTPYVANDYFWTGFATEGTSRVLLALLNTQLNTRVGRSLDLLSLSLPTDFSDTVPSSYGRRLLYDDLTKPVAAVRSLRALDVALIKYLAAKYCWVDFGRAWELGTSERTMARCIERDIQNGAVYMETIFRNVPFQEWYAHDATHLDKYLFDPIRQSSPAGSAYVRGIQHYTWLPVDDEVAVWKQSNIDTFQLLYSNRVRIGVQESIGIVNALGIVHPLMIKSIPSVQRGLPDWTTSFLTGTLQYDLMGLMMAPNMSLVRNTPGFFADTDPAMVELFLLGNISPVNRVLHATLDFLTNIRLRYIVPPTSLTALVAAFDTHVLNTLRDSTTFATAMALVPASTAVLPAPVAWTGHLSYGGSPLCGYGNPLPLIQESFAFDDACVVQLPLTYSWTPFSGLFAASLTPLASSSAFCAHQAPTCAIAVARTLHALSQFTPSTLRVPDDAKDWAVSIAQFLAPMTHPNNISLATQPLLDDDNVWAPFGWLSLYDWAHGNREVVAFEGDHGTLRLMSAAYPAVVAPRSAITSASVGAYLWYSALLTSVVLVLVASIILVLYTLGRAQCTPHWFHFHRISSSIYLNWGLLFVRALLAAVCLSSAPVVPWTQGATRTLVQDHRSLWTSMFLAGETLWLLFVAQECLHPILLESLHKWTAGAAWCVIVLLDVASPVSIEASIAHACTATDMDMALHCEAGSVRIGSCTRVLMILGVQLGSVLVATVGSFLCRESLQSHEQPPLLLPPMVLKLFPTHEKLDDVTAAMCGLLWLPWWQQLFSIKLWLLVPAGRCASIQKLTVVPTTNNGSPILFKHQATASRVAKAAPFILAAGLVYIGCTLVSNVAYLSIAADYMANDFFWANFNTSGAYAFLATRVNAELLVGPSSLLELESTKHIDYFTAYDGSQPSALMSAATATRRALFHPNVSTLEAAITGLRAMHPCQLPWMATQYCYLDLGRVWEMASTAKRQERCRHMTRNGAVFLETALRNVHDWDAFDSCWGDAFASGIVTEVGRSSYGKAWLQQTTRVTNEVADEVALWRRANVSEFTLQWQNYKTIGFDDSLLVENALDLRFPLPLAQVAASFHPTRQTSMVMYWGFASDLWAIGRSNQTVIGGLSLLRSSPHFAFTNKSRQDLLVDNLTLSAPLQGGYVALSAALGPFNAVDMLYVLCPTPVLQLYRGLLTAVAILTTGANASMLQASYLSIPTSPLVIAVPSLWLATPMTIIAVGGNIFCPVNQVGGPFFMGYGVGFADASFCNTFVTDNMEPSINHVLFATLGFNATLHLAPDVDWRAICTLNTYLDSDCVAKYTVAENFLQQHAAAFTDLAPLAISAYTAVQALDVQLLQYVLNITGMDMANPNMSSMNMATLLQSDLLAVNDRPWNYYAWLLLFEWANGMREVVSFQGDNGTLTTLSQPLQPLSMAPDPRVIRTSYAPFLQSILQYISGVLIAIAGLMLLYTLHMRGVVEGLNLFELNRIVGMVWVGRSFLIVRSVTALCLLNTATLTLVRLGAGTHFASPHLPWFKVLLASAESTWLVYVLNDVFSCVTHQYTPYYAFKSSLLAWGVTFFWTLLSPLAQSAQLQRTCAFVDMDAALVCVSGVVHLGSLSRVLTAVGIAFGCVFGCYVAERLVRPYLPKNDVPTLALNAQSFYILELYKYEHEYFLDTASAAMAGILSLSFGQNVYILDVKMWRFLVIPAPKRSAFHPYHRCLPLNAL